MCFEIANGFSELRKDLEFVISKGSQDERLLFAETFEMHNLGKYEFLTFEMLFNCRWNVET